MDRRPPERHINRRRSRAARLGRGWCHYCDRALVPDGGKCVVCRRVWSRRDKKQVGGGDECD